MVDSLRVTGAAPLVSFDVKPAHFATADTALLKTPAQGLGESFTDATRQAWVTVYGVMADVVLVASQDS